MGQARDASRTKPECQFSILVHISNDPKLRSKPRHSVPNPRVNRHSDGPMNAIAIETTLKTANEAKPSTSVPRIAMPCAPSLEPADRTIGPKAIQGQRRTQGV